MGQVDRVRTQEGREDLPGFDERGTSFMTVMIMMLMTGSLGVAALTMTGLENSMAGSIRMWRKALMPQRLVSAWR